MMKAVAQMSVAESTSESKTHWRDGLEEVGNCPHCGIVVMVKTAEIWPPTPMYLCECRLAGNAPKQRPATSLTMWPAASVTTGAESPPLSPRRQCVPSGPQEPSPPPARRTWSPVTPSPRFPSHDEWPPRPQPGEVLPPRYEHEIVSNGSGDLLKAVGQVSFDNS